MDLAIRVAAEIGNDALGCDELVLGTTAECQNQCHVYETVDNLETGPDTRSQISWTIGHYSNQTEKFQTMP
jgi:hypothetical protein